MRDFENIFRELNLPQKKMPQNYSPDIFAKQLLKKNKKNLNVSYAISTTQNKD